MESIYISTNNQFFINKYTKLKVISYKDYRYDKKHNGYEIHNIIKEFKLGVQLCDFINTNFKSFDSVKLFIEKYGITSIANFSDISLSNYYTNEEYQDMLNKVVNSVSNELEKIKKAFISDVKYIYNLNDLGELQDLSPAKRLYVLRGSNKGSKVLSLFDSENLKLEFNNFGDFTKFSIKNEDDVQEIANNIDTNLLNSYSFSCSDIIQSFIIELLEMAEMDTIEIKKCKNCGKFFVPENRSDELYCGNIYENGKTCKEVGHFRKKQKLMKENDDLRIYRNVYQKLLLRTRRNPNNSEYEKDFKDFKEKNLELKEKINNNELTQEDYMKWLNEQ